jgi:hypothetical protein
MVGECSDIVTNSFENIHNKKHLMNYFTQQFLTFINISLFEVNFFMIKHINQQ